ncbi:MAG: winged helix DNA-binding domain-containing protein [Roseburia sp.]|nr:winged helix DNA-binding domain-containing protein [Roseburia sp.]
MDIEVTKEQMRDFYVNYHGFYEFFDCTAENAISRIFDRIRSVQFDPLNVAGRNAELVLFSRNGGMTRQALYDALYTSRTLVDGWDKMMSIFRAEDFPKLKFLRDEQERQYSQIMAWRRQEECFGHIEEVYAYIKEHGASLPADIPCGTTNGGGWGSAKIANICCEYLWHCGRLCVADKKGVVKSYDLTERLIGVDPYDNEFSDTEEFLRRYVLRRISEVGAARPQNGGAWLGAYLEDGEPRGRAIEELTQSGKTVPVRVKDIGGRNNVFYINSGDERFFRAAPRDRAVLLAPLDNMMWDRKAVKSIFDFEYTWEVYVPAQKRKYGYYVLPILIGNEFVGRLEPMQLKSGEKLAVKNVWFEESYIPRADDTDMILAELQRLARFLDTELASDTADKLVKR